MKRYAVFASIVVAAGVASACGTSTEAYSPESVQQRYGLTGAYTDTIATPDGSISGTVVPVTLADGRAAHLVISADSRRDPHPLYLRDSSGSMYPVRLQDNARRDDVVRSPVVVARETERPHPRKRSWEKEAMIIGGSAAGGAAIGALAGGKKGAAVGAASGGIGGLIYDLATRKKD
jgi:hypothetical protein